MATSSPPVSGRSLDESTEIAAAPFVTFDSLPDEILLKIVKLAASQPSSNRPRYDHNYLLDVVGNISLRFRGVAADRLGVRRFLKNGIPTPGGLGQKVD